MGKKWKEPPLRLRFGLGCGITVCSYNNIKFNGNTSKIVIEACVWLCARETLISVRKLYHLFSPVPRQPPSCSPRAQPGGHGAACRNYWRNIWYKNMSYTAPLSWDISLLPKNCPALIQSPLSFFSLPSIWTGFNYNENMCCVIKTLMHVLSHSDSRCSPLHTSSSY